MVIWKPPMKWHSITQKTTILHCYDSKFSTCYGASFWLVTILHDLILDRSIEYTGVQCTIYNWKFVLLLQSILWSEKYQNKPVCFMTHLKATPPAMTSLFHIIFRHHTHWCGILCYNPLKKNRCI
jgi:hypothetical protein